MAGNGYTHAGTVHGATVIGPCSSSSSCFGRSTISATATGIASVTAATVASSTDPGRSVSNTAEAARVAVRR